MKTRVLVTVKTYPTLSKKYEELVCTAGFTEGGEWRRVYPIPFRKKEYSEQYKKYDWIELDMVRNEKDPRPESYRPCSMKGEIKVLGHIDTAGNWRSRKKIVLKKVYKNLEQLIAEAKDKKIGTSLAVFKPIKVVDFTEKEVEREWDEKKIAKLEAQRRQGHLFEHPENPFRVVRKLPYKFSYVIEDDSGKK